MEKISISFLDVNYTLPLDIITYRNYHHGFELLRQELLSYMEDNYGDCENWPDLENAERKFREFAEQCVKWLCEDGVYDKTANDFIEENAGFDLYQETVKQTLIRRAEILSSYLKGLQADIVNAESQAASNITGTGFEVYSSSIVDIGIWAAMERSTLKKQAAEADKQYNRLVNEAVDRGTEQSDKKKSELNRTYWLPKMKESVDLFIAVLLEKYIQALIEAKKFDIEALSFLDFRRAEMILKNISSAADKKQLIREAFLKCPFCPGVYMVVIEQNLFGDDEYNTLSVFEVNTVLRDMLQESLETTGEDTDTKESVLIERMTPSANVLAKIKGTSLDQELSAFLQKRREKKLKSLQELRELSYDSPEFDALIRDILSKSVCDIIISFAEKENVKRKFVKYVWVEYLKDDDSTYYDTEKKQAIIALLKNAKCYVEEAVRRKRKFAEATEHFKRVSEDVNAQIVELSAQREALGWARFARRKNIDEKIAHLREIELAEKNKLEDIKNSFITMYSGENFLISE